MAKFVVLGALAGLGGLGWVMWSVVAAQSPQLIQRTYPGIVYATSADESLELDLAMPGQGEGPFPAVVCIHGGGWTGGNRKQMTQTLDVLARRGYVAVAIDYRLAPKHPFPACLEDCKAAVRWLRAHAAEYRVDTAKVAALGLSAGGHLACLLGMTEVSDGFEGNGENPGQASRVQAVVSFASPTDLTDELLWTREVLERNLQPLLGGPPRTHAQEYRRASPVSYAPKSPPPFLLVHGSADRTVPVRQAHALVARLHQLGGQARVLVLEGEGHTWAGKSLAHSIDQMLTFLDNTLKK